MQDPFQNEDAIKWGDGFIIVYSVINKSSFKAAMKFVEDVRTIKVDAHIEIPIAVVGNKSDLLHLKQVSDSELEKLARELNCRCFQVSASDGYMSVVEPFLCICRQVRQIQRQKEKLKGFLQKPSVSSKLRIRQSLQKRFSDMKHRARTSTM